MVTILMTFVTFLRWTFHLGEERTEVGGESGRVFVLISPFILLLLSLRPPFLFFEEKTHKRMYFISHFTASGRLGEWCVETHRVRTKKHLQIPIKKKNHGDSYTAKNQGQISYFLQSTAGSTPALA